MTNPPIECEKGNHNWRIIEITATEQVVECRYCGQQAKVKEYDEPYEEE